MIENGDCVVSQNMINTQCLVVHSKAAVISQCQISFDLSPRYTTQDLNGGYPQHGHFVFGQFWSTAAIPTVSMVNWPGDMGNHPFDEGNQHYQRSESPCSTAILNYQRLVCLNKPTYQLWKLHGSHVSMEKTSKISSFGFIRMGVGWGH